MEDYEFKITTKSFDDVMNVLSSPPLFKYIYLQGGQKRD